MKNLRHMLILVAGLGLCSFLGGCSVQNQLIHKESLENETIGGTPVSVVSWNLQTFFDGKKEGCEYKEFQKSADWNNEKYKVRLERLCNFITQVDADIFIFEELENEDIIYDISNQLAAGGHNWNQKKFWNYSVFAKEKNTAIGIGILSRYPLNNVKTHFMDIRIHNTNQPSTRYILEAEASIEKKKLVILANHWKSKSGGEQQTEIWRDWQESILGKRLSELLHDNSTTPAILICGDFNRNAADFICNRKNQKNWKKELENTIIRYADFGYTDFIDINSLWFNDYGDYVCTKGSYFYNDKWERIDNIFIAGNIRKLSFEPLAINPWASEQGYPIPYKIYSGQGWSDHLPLFARFSLTE